MAYLHLHLSEFSSSFGVGESLREGWRANWKVGMGFLQSVKLSNGSDLAQMQGWLNLKPGEIENSSDKAIGLLSYYPATEASPDGVCEAQPETYFVEVVLREEQLLRLIESERQGHGPTGVSVDVPKLGYGNFPDGSDKNWELSDERNWLPVEGLTFSFTRPERDELADAVDDEIPAQAAPSAEMQAIRAVSDEIAKVFAWVIGLLALIAIVLIAK
jgi:hypothetical protein